MNPSDLLTVAEALDRWPGRFTANELREGMRRGVIAHVRKSGRNWLTVDGLQDYLDSLKVKVTPCPTGKDESPPSSSSEASGSNASPPLPSSTDSGMTPELRKFAADQLARKILNARKKTLPPLSRRGRQATPNPQRVSS